MNTMRRTEPRAGFAFLGVLLVLVVMAVAAAIGLYVWRYHTKVGTPVRSSMTHEAATGTTTHVLQLTQGDAQTEASIDSGADMQAQQDSQSANTAQTNVGGAYDEAAF